MDNYKEMENKLIEMIKQKEKTDRFLLTLEWVIGILSCIVLILPIFVGELLHMEDWQLTLTVLSCFIPAIIGLGFAIRIEQIAGYYECKHCKHRYVPTYKAIIFAPHSGRIRYMRCPECNKKSWQKKVIGKG